MVKAKDSVEALKRYVAPTEGRRGKLRLDFNENTIGPSPKVITAIRALEPEYYAAYPEYAGLCESYAEHLSVQPENIVPFNGVDAAIRGVFQAFARSGEKFLSAQPTFGYYAPCAAQEGMEQIGVSYEADLSFPIAAFEEKLRGGASIAFICNPNNPTSTILGREVIFDFADRYPETLFVIDELYADFVRYTVLPEGLERKNLIVLRSLSKSCGLAALRIGFAVAHPETAEKLQKICGPYEIGTMAVVGALAALEDIAYTEGYIAEVDLARAYCLAEFEKRGLRYYCSGGNYLLLWPGVNVEELVHKLDEEHGILVRSMSGKALIDGSFRLTVGTRQDMARFVDALDKALLEFRN